MDDKNAPVIGEDDLRSDAGIRADDNNRERVLDATVRDATHVLEGLLYYESRPTHRRILTAGFTDHAGLRSMNGVHLGSFDLNLLVALDALLTERSVTRAKPFIFWTTCRLRFTYPENTIT